jgi:hypothetical protein
LEYPPGIPGIVVETDTREFLLLVGLLVALTIVVLVLLASQQLRHVCQQLTAPDRPDAENEPGNGRPTTAWGWLQRRAIREGGPSKDEPTASKALQQRLAVRVAYHRHFDDPPPAAEEHAAEPIAAGPPRPRPARPGQHPGQQLQLGQGLLHRVAAGLDHHHHHLRSPSTNAPADSTVRQDAQR